MRDLVFGLLILFAITVGVLSNMAVVALVAGGMFAFMAYVAGSRALRGAPDSSSASDKED